MLALLSGCGGRTTDVGDDDWFAAGAWSNGGASSSGSTTSQGGSLPQASGGFIGKGGSSYNTFGGYTSHGATGGIIFYASGGWSTGGYRATGGNPYAIGGKATGGSYTGGRGGAGGLGGYYGGVSGKGPTAGSAGFLLRGGSSGMAGSVFVAGRGGVAGGGGTSGASGSAGVAHAGATSCPAIDCATSCPLGYWNNADGCLTCACAPPDKKLAYSTVSCPSDSLSVSVVAQQQTGTWVFKFSWLCSAAASSLGQPLNASVGVTIFNSSIDPITSSNRTIKYYAAMSSVPIVFSEPQIVVAGSGLPQITIPLTVLDGAYLSIRREGSDFVGGLYLPAIPTSSTSTTETAMLAGSFRVAVPL